jgi:glycerol-3-phosphate dehydrogenase
VNDFFPKIALAENDIVSSWAGVRPLIANRDGSPSDISRAHQIRCPEPAWWDIAGGKLTTYRLMAEQAVDQIVQHLGAKAQPCRTAAEPLLSGAEATAYSGILPAPCTREAVHHYVRHEWARRLEDVLLRRSGWHYYHRFSQRRIDEIAGWMAEATGWTPTEMSTEVEAFCARARFAPAA